MNYAHSKAPCDDVSLSEQGEQLFALGESALETSAWGELKKQWAATVLLQRQGGVFRLQPNGCLKFLAHVRTEP